MRKLVLTTNADNCFKLLSKFPDCTLQVLTLFVAQYPPPCYCIVHCIDLFNSEWNNGFITNWSWKHTKSHVASCDETMKATTSCYCIYSVFFQKTITRQKSIKNPYYKLLSRFFFWISLPYKTRLLRFASAQRHRGTIKIIGFRGFIVGPKA